MKHLLTMLWASLSIAFAAPPEFTCDLTGYKQQDGLTAQLRGGVLEVTWQGERREQLRAGFTIRDGKPVVQEIAARKDGGPWIVLGQNLSPEFEITSGIRRLSQQQISPLRQLGVSLTPDVVEREKWNAFGTRH